MLEDFGIESKKNVCGVHVMVIYFSKVNLESIQLLEMYKKEELLMEMKKAIVSFLKSGTVYEVEGIFVDENGEKHTYTTRYRISIGAKKDDYISGYIYKSAAIYYKTLNEITLKPESHVQNTIEDVRFYYDVSKEIVGFHTRNRFGYQEFNNAFREILNMCMNQNNCPLKFGVSLYNEGLEIEEIKSVLKSINNIKKLEFRYKLPNPADDYMLDELEEGLTDVAEALENANANSMSVIFDSDGGIGLNIESTEIRNNIGRVGKLTKGVDAKSAVKNGYAYVKATGKDGKIYTTEEKKPIRREIDDDSEDSFFTACRDTILSMFTPR